MVRQENYTINGKTFTIKEIAGRYAAYIEKTYIANYRTLKDALWACKRYGR